MSVQLASTLAQWMRSAAQPSIRWVDRRHLDPDQDERLVQFLGRAFVEWPGLPAQLDPHQHFEWKMGEFPSGSSILMAEDGSRMLGLWVMLHRRWLVRGRVRSVRDVVDLSVDPENRGQGIYRLMSRYAQKHVNPHFDMSLVYLNTPQTRRVGRQVGERSLANRIAVLAWVPSARRMATRRRKRGSRLPAPLVIVGISLIKMTNRLLYGGTPPASTEWEVRTVDRFDGRVQSFAREASSAFELVQERSTEYLNWRYADPRGGSFTIRLAEDREEILGYAVLSSSGDRAFIVDLMALPGRADVAAALIGDAKAIFAADGISQAICWLPRFHPYYGLLRRAGFIDSHKAASAAYRPLKLAGEELSFLERKQARIHLMLGDADGV